MIFDHVGIMNEDEEGAVRFYRGVLGLEKIRESLVSHELARQLFSLDREIKMLVFGKEDIKVEIFIIPGLSLPYPSVPHFCLQAPDPDALLEKAKKEGANVISAERGGRPVHFVEDFSGNRIELKPLA
jgi:catechol 2,3-dioxygenase-like lactoylglutathione lyase family enzyme